MWTQFIPSKHSSEIEIKLPFKVAFRYATVNMINGEQLSKMPKKNKAEPSGHISVNHILFKGELIPSHIAK